MRDALSGTLRVRRAPRSPFHDRDDLKWLGSAKTSVLCDEF
jgi:hypothetical protein